MFRGQVNTLRVEDQQGMPMTSYTTPFQYGAQLRNEDKYKVHEYIDERKLACFTNPFQSPYPKIDIDLKYFKILCEDMDDKNCGDINGQTALHALCLYGSVNAIKILMDVGADLFCEDLAGFSLAHYCCMSDRQDLLAFLDRKGAAITKQALATSRTPLHVASMCNSVNCVRYLLDSGVNCNQADNYGYSALWLAMFYRNDAVCLLLAQKGAQLNVTEVDKVSFPFRTLQKCPGYGEWLLDSYITSCPFRAVSLVWLNKLVNGNSYENTDMTHCYLYLNPPERTFIEHPVMRSYTRIAWEQFGRKSALITFIRDVLFSFLWTFHYMSDNGRTFRDASNVARIVAYCLLVPYTGYTIYYLTNWIRLLWRTQDNHLRFEMNMTHKELDNLHPCMWNANHVLQREKKILTNRRSHLNILQVLGQHVGDLSVNVLSLVVLVLDIVFAIDTTSRDSRPRMNWLYRLATSTVLITVWATTFNKMKYFKEFGAFLVSVKKLAHLLLKFAAMYIVFYIPIACIFWKTIYESTNHTNGTEPNSTLTGVNSTLTSVKTVPLPDALYRVYRMTFSNYDYGSGLAIAASLGIPSWWNILTFYWITVGGLILLRVLGGMIFAVLAEPLRESQYRAYKDRLSYICELVMSRSAVQRQGFARYLEFECKPYITEQYVKVESKSKDVEAEVAKLNARLNQLTDVFLPEHSIMSSSSGTQLHLQGLNL